MGYRETPLLAAALALSAVCTTLGQTSQSPLMGLLGRFTAANLPALGPAEIELAPRTFESTRPPGLPGNGLAHHPML